MNARIYLFLALGLLALTSSAHAASTSFSVMINTINGTNPAFSPSGLTAYAINGTHINVINVQTNTITNIITVPQGTAQAVTFPPKGNIAYLTTSQSVGMGAEEFSIAVINVSTNKFIANISDITGSFLGESGGLPSVIFSPSGSTAYFTSGIHTAGSEFEVYVINVSTNSVIKSITLPDRAAGIALNPSGTILYATDYYNSTVSVINTTTYSTITNITVGSYPIGIAINPSGSLGYVANSGNGIVSVFSTVTNKVIKTITVGPSPSYVVFNLNGSLAYVADSGTNEISVINVNDNTVVYNINLNALAQTEAFNPNSHIQLLYVGDSNGNIEVVDQINSITTSPTTLILPIKVFTSDPKGLVKVTVSGTGFTPDTLVNLGYALNFPPDANAIFATITNSTGGWSGSFSAPWNKGDYTMVAIDAKGDSATATLNVINTSEGVLILPTTTPSSSAGLVNVIVSGKGFAPNTLVNLGYSSDFPPYSNAIFATTTNSTGGWTGVFHAPWNVGTYDMTAIDADGVTTTAQLVVSKPAPVLYLPTNVTPSNSADLDMISIAGTGFTPNILVNLGYYPSFWTGSGYNYANAIVATTTNSTGGWYVSFYAPWNAGNYIIAAQDAQGVNATATLIVK